MYHISEILLKKAIFEAGYVNISEFAQKNRLNRNVIHAYLRGNSVFTRQFNRIIEALKVDPFHILEQNASVSIRMPSELSACIEELTGRRSELCFVLLGSRSRGTYNRFSDWDIGVSSVRRNLNGRDYLILKETFLNVSEDLTEEFDLVNLDCAPSWFLETIGTDITLLSGNNLAFSRLKTRCTRDSHAAKVSGKYR